MGLLDLFFSSNSSNTTTSTSISTASKTEAGIVKVGENINVSKGVISVPLATSYESQDTPGVVTVGEGLILGQNGRISVPYADGEGGAGIVQCGQNIEISTNGMISVPTASTDKAGVVKVGTGLAVTRGVLSVSPATSDKFGVVKAGENVQIIDGAISIPLATSYEGNDIPGVVTVGDGLILGKNGRISVPYADSEGGAGIVQCGQNIEIGTNGMISVPTASTDKAGVVKVGDGLTITRGILSIQTATSDKFGVVKAGENVQITNGVISVPLATSYESNDMPGVVTVGEGLILGKNGRISVPRANDQGGAGIVQAGANVIISENGIISVPTATNRRLGVVKPGKGITIADDGTISVEKESNGWFTLIQGPDASKLTPDPKNGKNQKITIGSDLKVYDPYLDENTPELTLEITKLEETTVSIYDKVALDPSTIGTYLIKWYFNGTYTCRLDPIKVHVVPARPF